MKTILACLIALTSVAHSHELSLTDNNSYTNIKSVPSGQSIQINQVNFDHLGTVSLNLKRLKVFADDAKVMIHDKQVTRKEDMPNNVYFTGNITTMDGSRVFIGFLDNGKIEGIVELDDGEKYILNWQQNNQFKLDKPNTDSLVNSDNRYFNPKDYIEIPESEVLTKRVHTNQPYGTGIDYQLTVAIETDFEFYQIFNDTNSEVNYITGLIGYLSSMYYNELNTYVLLGTINLRTSQNDPWTATNSACALMEVGKYWNDNYDGINRAMTHFMSGKSLGGGIAWQGVLCSTGFSYNISSYNCSFDYPDNSNYGGAYGVSGSLSGSFNPNNPQSLWDIVVVTHEIGHNFDSPHSHCYAGEGGNPNPVDECYNGESGCYSGTQTLPGPINQGSGTIMSYCHLLSGGLNNISLNLGTNHAYGEDPIRVPNRMRAHVEQVANAQPQCIMPAANDLIFMNGFE